MAKIHLVASEFPTLRFNGDLLASCGKMVRNVFLLRLWDDLPMTGRLEFPPGVNVCPECRQIVDDNKERCTVYGITERKEERE